MSQRHVIALVCDVIYPYSHGGRELRYRELLPRLAEHAEVHIYTMHWWNGPAVYTDEGVTYHAISRLLPLYKNNRRSIRQALQFGIASLRLLWCHFDVLEADHIPYFQVFVLRIVATLKRKPFTVTWHEVWSRSYWREYLGWMGWAAWSVEWLSMRLPDRIIAASPETAERLQRALGRRKPIIMVPNGIDLDTIHSADPDDVVRDLVVVGRLIEHKRVDMVLEVIALLHRSGMHVTCRIIGDGPERVALEERARALGILHAVEFRYDVREQKELYTLVKGAKLFVSLSTREGFGIAVLEAIACGVRVLTTSASDNLAQHLVAKYSRGIVCEPTLDAVTAAVQSSLIGADDSLSYDDRTDRWIADYDWGAMTDRIVKAYFGQEGAQWFLN
jgi:glycosyltransferase involved in cell wall biosynthesis